MDLKQAISAEPETAVARFMLIGGFPAIRLPGDPADGRGLEPASFALLGAGSPSENVRDRSPWPVSASSARKTRRIKKYPGIKFKGQT